MSTEVYTISTEEAILRIKKVIENQQGDRGRLEFISEALKKGKKLFQSDQNYLKQKILAEVVPSKISGPTERERKIKKVKRLMSLNLGEPERLRHILHCLENNRKIYNSDEQYIQLKTEQFLKFSEGKRLRRHRVRFAPEPKPEKFEEVIYEPISEIEKESSIVPPQDLTDRLEKIEEAVLSKPKNNVDLIDLLEDSTEVNLGIEKEKRKISKLKHDHEQLKIQRDELSKLIAYRQEYEIKINHEKEILEKEIKIEQSKVREKDKLVEELIQNQSKIIQTKSEKEVLLEQIKIEKAQSDLDLKREQDELERVKKEYQKLQNEIVSKKQEIEKKIKEQQQIRGEKIDTNTSFKESTRTAKKNPSVNEQSRNLIEDPKSTTESGQKLEKLNTDFEFKKEAKKEMEDGFEKLKTESEELRDFAGKDVDDVEKSVDQLSDEERVREAKKKLDRLKTDFDDN